jgi:hypothetical protein
VKIKYLAGTVALLGLIMSCAEQPSKQLSNKTVDRPLLSHWYDSTYLEYYDAYGPVRSIANPRQKLEFNQNGRLLRQLSQDGDGDFEVRYAYHDDGRLDRITSYRNGGEYRLSEYLYDENNELRQVRFLDYGSGQQFHSKHKTQRLKSGWFAVDIPVEQIDLPLYKQFDDGGQLVWSSKSGFNHGVGRHFNLPVGDSVFS